LASTAPRRFQHAEHLTYDLPARDCRISKKPMNDLRWEHLFKTVLKDGKKPCADPFALSSNTDTLGE
jgi:hypothetical protein